MNQTRLLRSEESFCTRSFYPRSGFRGMLEMQCCAVGRRSTGKHGFSFSCGPAVYSSRRGGFLTGEDNDGTRSVDWSGFLSNAGNMPMGRNGGLFAGLSCNRDVTRGSFVLHFNSKETSLTRTHPNPNRRAGISRARSSKGRQRGAFAGLSCHHAVARGSFAPAFTSKDIPHTGILPKLDRKGVISHAGRSKVKRGLFPGGRIKSLESRKMHKRVEKVKEREPPEPYTRHPDDYYKYGPYGPYGDRTPVVGTLKRARFLSQKQVVMWSPLKDLNEIEQFNIHMAILSYDNRVKTFDEDKLQFFLVFVRLPFRYGQEVPWKQWTLVSQVTVESDEQLDKEKLYLKLSPLVKNRITQHTAWFRPDLIYVKKPLYQIRYEPEDEFITELKKLLASCGEEHEASSFYGVFCQILGVSLNANFEEVVSKYEESPEEIQLACLEHIFTSNPAQLLHHLSFPTREARVRQGMPSETKRQPGIIEENLPAGSEKAHLDAHTRKSSEDAVHNYEKGDSIGNTDVDNSYSDGFYDDYDDDSNDDDDDDDEDDDDIDLEHWDSEKDETDFQNAVEDTLSDGTSEVNPDGDDKGAQHGSEMSSASEYLRAATRPFTYVNFIRELVMLRYILLERKRAGFNVVE